MEPQLIEEKSDQFHDENDFDFNCDILDSTTSDDQELEEFLSI